MNNATLGIAVLGAMRLGWVGIEFPNLITDRTQDHVNRLKLLSAKGWDNMSASQQKEYLEYAAKGAYNYTDLNRVEMAVTVLSSILNMNLTTKTNWTRWDVPTKSDMKRYLDNVSKIRERYITLLDMPVLPESMNCLTYEGANNIEKVLQLAYDCSDTGVRCGDVYSGEVI